MSRIAVSWIAVSAAVLLLLPASVTRAQTAAAGAAPDSVPAAAAQTGSISGTVAGSDGEAYEGAQVTLAISAAQPAQTAETDSNGEFLFPGVPAGEFTLTVASQGFVTQTVRGVVAPGETFDAKTIVLPMVAATNEVRVSAAGQVEIAEEQIHIEEQQRVLGILPNYYVSYDKNPMPLTSKQKFSLAWKSNFNPFTFVLTGAAAGLEQATNTFVGYGQGMQGYGKRFGANYADTFFSNEIGGAILPSLFHQDPRYFYKGTGTIKARAEYAIAMAVICKGDNMRWQFNYSGILGGLAAGGISNLYYPASDRSSTAVIFENLGVGLAGSALQNVFQEFVVKKLTPSARKAHSQ